ncbi:MAG: glycosyltransferase family 4 protein [Candidatus Helarchaeota archaeon]|nr:glycosyltransferase family 4 protein [Candidatus Helarchaeota archaeon]
MQEVVKQISERLVKLGHDVTVATTKLLDRKDEIIGGVKIVEFNISGNAVRGYRFGEVDKYRQFLLNSNFDIITNFAAQQWATDLALPILDQIKAKKVFVPTGFSGLYFQDYKAYFEKMSLCMKQYDMNVFLSDDYRDIHFAREHKITKCALIPNGASEDEFLSKPKIDMRNTLGIPKNNCLILHVGSHTGEKGHAEAIKIFDKANIKDATLLIIANDVNLGCTKACKLKAQLFRFIPGKWFLYGIKGLIRSLLSFHFVPTQWLNKKKLIVTSLSREETVAAYLIADLFLFPSNIECSPLVLFECMASRTPFLASDAGNAGEIVSWSNAGTLLPTNIDGRGYSRVRIDKSAEILERIYNDRLLRERMGDAGFKAWQERFTWGKIAKQYEELYLKLLAER